MGRGFTAWLCSCGPLVSPVWWRVSCHLGFSASLTWRPSSALVSLKSKVHCYYGDPCAWCQSQCSDASPANILLKSLESIFMTTSALTWGSPCPMLPDPLFKSRNQTPACSPYTQNNTRWTSPQDLLRRTGGPHRATSSGLKVDQMKQSGAQTYTEPKILVLPERSNW